MPQSTIAILFPACNCLKNPIFWIIIITLGAWTAPAQALSVRPAASIETDPDVASLMDQVLDSTLYQYVAGLSGEAPVSIGGEPFTLASRSTLATVYIAKATQYVYEHFQNLGLTVQYQPWTTYGLAGRNVIAEQTGIDPDCIYLLTAHVDSTSPTPDVLAPGADDNGSGTAGVMVAADILSQKKFICTLRYIVFSGEEQGLLGSDAYAKAAAARGDSIQGVLNLDMIAYNTANSPTTIELDIRSGASGDKDKALADAVSGVIQAYQLDLVAQILPSDEWGSDHYSFWQQGFPAVLVEEDWNDHSPFYHKTTDRVSTLNMPYFTAFTKAALGALAHLAQFAPDSHRIYLPNIQR